MSSQAVFTFFRRQPLRNEWRQPYADNDCPSPSDNETLTQKSASNYGDAFHKSVISGSFSLILSIISGIFSSLHKSCFKAFFNTPLLSDTSGAQSAFCDDCNAGRGLYKLYLPLFFRGTGLFWSHCPTKVRIFSRDQASYYSLLILLLSFFAESQNSYHLALSNGSLYSFNPLNCNARCRFFLSSAKTVVTFVMQAPWIQAVPRNSMIFFDASLSFFSSSAKIPVGYMMQPANCRKFSRKEPSYTPLVSDTSAMTRVIYRE